MSRDRVRRMRAGLGLILAVLVTVLSIAGPGMSSGEENPQSAEQLRDRIAETQRSFVMIVANPAGSAATPGYHALLGRAKARRLVGCGVVLDGAGHLLTTSHVVRNARNVTVIPFSGMPVQGEVVGTDPLSDLAVVRLPAGRMPEAPMGNSDSLETGAWITLLGAGFGSGSVASLGVITGRAQPSAELGGDMLRVYAPIRPGDSGAILLNGRGEVVGIVFATLEGGARSSREGGSTALKDYVEGIAIPINRALSTAWRVIERGPIRLGFLGVRIKPVSEPLVKTLGLEAGVGALVVAVIDGSPAAASGIRPGDVIAAFEGTPLVSLGQLHRSIVETPPGTNRELTLFHAGERRVLTIEIGDSAPYLDQAFPRVLLEPGSPAPRGGDGRRQALAQEVGILKARLAELERQVESLDR